jgi:sugar phosphate isomerase/epimerase
VTNEEIELLRSLCQVEVLTFAPEGTTPAALERFDQILAMLRRMERAGWVNLEVTRGAGGSRRRYQRKPRIAAARCTERGREALRRQVSTGMRGPSNR